MNKFKVLCFPLFLSYIGPGTGLCTEQIDVYFSNDSMNGFQLSDAYETHEMGIKYSSKKKFFDLNLAIVSPDMYLYRNRFREANRAYGEVISLSWGAENTPGYFNFSATGKFGLDGAQDQVHRLLSLQPVSDFNDLVRMPDRVYFGYGYKWEPVALPTGSTLLAYLGSDRTSVKYTFDFEAYGNDELSLIGSISTEYVHFDKIVSAKPIRAQHRIVIPEAKVEVNYSLSESLKLSISESFSLPTISSDNKLYARFSAVISYKLR